MHGKTLKFLISGLIRKDGEEKSVNKIREYPKDPLIAYLQKKFYIALMSKTN